MSKKTHKSDEEFTMRSVWMCSDITFTISRVHKSRVLSKQAEDKQSFAIVLSILDRPCFGFYEWIFFWNASSSLFLSIVRLWFREVHRELARRIYCQIEGHVTIHQPVLLNILRDNFSN